MAEAGAYGTSTKDFAAILKLDFSCICVLVHALSQTCPSTTI